MQRATPLLSGYLEASALEWLDSARGDRQNRVRLLWTCCSFRTLYKCGYLLYSFVFFHKLFSPRSLSVLSSAAGGGKERCEGDKQLHKTLSNFE